MTRPTTKLALARPTRVLSDAASRLEEGEEIAVKFRVPRRVHKALKVRCAERGMSVQAYMRELLEKDGVK
jgi:predicted DNA binding CopG/RHH family protein